MTPPPLAPLAEKKIKSRLFSPFFIRASVPIEPECSEMDNFDKFTLQKNGFNKKNIQGMLHMLEKSRLFLVGGG